MSILNEINQNMQRGKAPIVKELIANALEQGIPAKKILEEGLLTAMNVVGEKFKNNEVFVPEVLVAARAMNAGVEILKPYLIKAGVEDKGIVVIGTIKGDLHDIGKNLVKMMMEGKGLKVIDLGVSVTPEAFVAGAKEHNANVIACSALLTTTMGEMKNVVEKVKAENLNTKVIIGGAPITQSFCDSIGADGYSPDAATAAELALSLC
ncbi:MAG: 5-methyltetrahydrofolate--homocysteine methyltransferase [Clostridiales bacterium GWF2_36_10]|nr:MAG: 5-methyltetrahydrofolate--homocysteine methyltransferase [Clostridiales bacterium GWF2_36_10]HAN20076.1 cobalamin-binding protein [Clostridiales bacterium]